MPAHGRDPRSMRAGRPRRRVSGIGAGPDRTSMTVGPPASPLESQGPVAQGSYRCVVRSVMSPWACFWCRVCSSGRPWPPTHRLPSARRCRYIDADGVTLGTVLIKEVGDPFTGSDPARPARRTGSATSGSPWPSPLRTTRRSRPIRRTCSCAPRTGTCTRPPTCRDRPRRWSPDLQAQTLAPGNRISGFIGYNGARGRRDRRDHVRGQLAIAPSRWPTSWRRRDRPPGQRSTTQADDGSQGSSRSRSRIPSWTSILRIRPQDGSRYVGLEVVATNPGEAPFLVAPSHIYLRDAAGNLYYLTNVTVRQGVLLPVLEAQTLAAGDLDLGLPRVRGAGRRGPRGRRPVAGQLGVASPSSTWSAADPHRPWHPRLPAPAVRPRHRSRRWRPPLSRRWPPRRRPRRPGHRSSDRWRPLAAPLPTLPASPFGASKQADDACRSDSRHQHRAGLR